MIYEERMMEETFHAIDETITAGRYCAKILCKDIRFADDQSIIY